jgi:hypothetical protein
MKYKYPLRKILKATRSHWHRPTTRVAVQQAFTAALKCQTLELGAEKFASEGYAMILPHTCKSRSCPGCGYRACMQWLRERWAALPSVPYKAITFTMPNLLWPLFRDNPRLAKALPALAATTISAHSSVRYGVQVGVIAILHTFNPKLEFNSHVHAMVTAGGLSEISASWAPSIFYDHNEIMRSWKFAVIELLRKALQSNQLHSALTNEELKNLLTAQEKRFWKIKIQSFSTKQHFLLYAGRYVRRPPIAQKRITDITDRNVTFWAKDKKLRRRVMVTCSLEDFVDRWSQHIPERYYHSVRGFGLFAPRSLSRTSATVFRILGQQRRKRPSPRPWADSIRNASLGIHFSTPRGIA